MRYSAYKSVLTAGSQKLSAVFLTAIVLGEVGFLVYAQLKWGNNDAIKALTVDMLPGANKFQFFLSSRKRAVAEEPIAAAPAAREPIGRREVKVETLHEDARIFLLTDFLSEEECDHIIELAKSRLTRSGVVDVKSGGTVMDSIRTSSGTFLPRGVDPVLAEIEQRIQKYTLLPVSHGEDLQVLRYEPTQKYGAHYDYFFTEQHTRHPAGNRYATFLMYLNDVEEGGETVFTNVPAPGGDNGPEFSECARYHLAAKPKKGSAVLFHSMTVDGKLERRSMHSACPVIKGEKWSAPKWLHERRFYTGREVAPQPSPYPGTSSTECEDRNDLCSAWAERGECEKNEGYMIGRPGWPGACLKSCNKCEMLRMGLGEAE